MRFHRILNSTRPSFPLPSRWAAIKKRVPQLKPGVGSEQATREKGRLEAESARRGGEAAKPEYDQGQPVARPPPASASGWAGDGCRPCSASRWTQAP